MILWWYPEVLTVRLWPAYFLFFSKRGSKWLSVSINGPPTPTTLQRKWTRGYFYIDVYWKILNRHTNVFFTGTRFYFVSQVFLSYLGECLIFVENIFRISPDFFGGSWRFFDIFFEKPMEYFEKKWNFLRKNWNLSRNKWRLLRKHWKLLRHKWQLLRKIWKHSRNKWKLLRKKWKLLRKKWKLLRKKWKLLRNFEKFWFFLAFFHLL